MRLTSSTLGLPPMSASPFSPPTSVFKHKNDNLNDNMAGKLDGES